MKSHREFMNFHFRVKHSHPLLSNTVTSFKTVSDFYSFWVKQDSIECCHERDDIEGKIDLLKMLIEPKDKERNGTESDLSEQERTTLASVLLLTEKQYEVLIAILDGMSRKEADEYYWAYIHDYSEDIRG